MAAMLVGLLVVSGPTAVGASEPIAGEATVSAGFSDVPAGQVFEEAVAWLVSEGITLGRGDGTFGLNDAVTRGAMAAFLYRFDGEPAGPFDAPDFDDVPDGHTFETEIAWLASTGITLGRGDGSFGLNDAVTRGAMAAFLYRYDGEPEGPFDAPDFDDVPDGHAFETEIAWLASTGITQGRGDGSFGLNDAVTRGAMAAFLYRYAGEPDFGFEPAPEPLERVLSLGVPDGATDEDRLPFEVPTPSRYIGWSDFDTPYPLDGAISTVFAHQLRVTADVSVDQVADWWLGVEDLASRGLRVCDAAETDCGVGWWQTDLLRDDARELHIIASYGPDPSGPISAFAAWLEPEADGGVRIAIWGYAG